MEDVVEPIFLSPFTLYPFFLRMEPVHGGMEDSDQGDKSIYLILLGCPK